MPRKDFASVATKVDIWHLLSLSSQTYVQRAQMEEQLPELKEIEDDNKENGVA